jgi:hypothetical protein
MVWLNWLSTDSDLAAYFDMEGSTSVITGSASANGGSASVSLSLSGSVASQGGETVANSAATAVVEADDLMLTVTGEAEASGATASTSIDLFAEIAQEDGVTVVTGSADTEAEAVMDEDGAASATTSADVELVHDDVIIAEDHDEDSEVGESASAESMAILDSVEVELVAIEPLVGSIWF